MLIIMVYIFAMENDSCAVLGWGYEEEPRRCASLQSDLDPMVQYKKDGKQRMDSAYRRKQNAIREQYDDLHKDSGFTSGNEGKNLFDEDFKSVLLLTDGHVLPEFLDSNTIRKHHEAKIQDKSWSLLKIRIIRHDLISNLKLHNSSLISDLIHEKGNFLILYDGSGNALSAFPIYTLHQVILLDCIQLSLMLCQY